MRQASDSKLPIHPRYGIRAISWSDVVAIESNRQGASVSNRSMKYGTHVHLMIEKGMLDVPRFGNPEQVYTATVPTGKGRGTFLAVGKIDDHDENTIIDYKTCKKLWTQKQADEHDQLKAYAFLLWKSTGKMPTKGVIVALETAYDEDVDDVVLTGNRRELHVDITLLDVLKIQSRFQLAYHRVQ